MLGSERVGFGCAHHPDFTEKFLGEEGGPEIVIAHVCGKNNRASGRSECLQKIFALQFPFKRKFEQPVNRCVGQGPSEIVEDAKNAEMIYGSWRTGEHSAKMASHRASR
jgi:hypothetical protein